MSNLLQGEHSYEHNKTETDDPSRRPDELRLKIHYDILPNKVTRQTSHPHSADHADTCLNSAVAG